MIKIKRLIILLILLLCVTGFGKTPSDVELVDSPATNSILTVETKSELSEGNKIGYQVAVNFVDSSVLIEGPGFLVTCLFVEDNIVYRYFIR